ncbi:glycoside hydrolase family 15 protein [Dactylosporangium aurantiacum]|uniref:Glycoside hydrolase family 15 protein n=1 Tax=Dactylosporangium aurantiacum TaxID=35754 RepID=A0A9Q9MB05_9ACTN|nr:glycoside hydrolase family 15 protein [Dactylosporangium aurantiacum]MDG6101790.1 glycoside hydrolase family 15 protein [Dactylosporangium aurantiacum]UWZ52403.1 glycoside hydrolase family 15 protein [Dactylosporangium aurantiacum]
MERYPEIGDHGLIGDLQTAALVSGDGTVDWFCCPRFDSPSVFASLLDADRGGYCRVAPVDGHVVSRQLYLPETAMLITRFMTEGGVGEVVDFMPVAGTVPTDRHRLVRMVRTVRGTMRFTFEVRPRFDYGRAPHKLEMFDEGAVFAGDGMELTVSPVGSGHRALDVHRDGDDLLVELTLDEGESAGVLLESMGGRPHRVPLAELEHLAQDTARYWRDWVNASTYRGRWREMVTRSAIALKLMTYAPTGAPVASPTAGLPEQVGGERNWDYRYTWIRDGSFSIHALLGLGYTEEAAAFGRWLRDRTMESAGSSSGPLKIMYRVDGSSDLTEETLEHLEGWRGSRPVRIGNDAADQLQLDIYGEALDAMYSAERGGIGIAHQAWLGLTDVIDWLCDHWDQPDEGVWETRGGRQDFTYGRFQCWVALDRALRLAAEHGRPADVARWTIERDNVYRQIMSRGWNAEKGTFTQHYGSDVVDAALLLMPLTGFVTPNDPLWESTLAAIERELVSDSLVYRYNPSASPDGLRGDEGTFSICTFWYVDALARAGRLTEAQLVFQKMQTYANPLGLFSEEIGLTGEQLGNFPQAFSHLSLINAAVSLDRRLEERARRCG